MGNLYSKNVEPWSLKGRNILIPTPPPPPPKTNVEDLLGLLHLQHSDLLTAQSTIQIMTGGGGGYVGTI